MGRVSGVGIATRYGLRIQGSEPACEARHYAPVQTAPGAYPASCTMGTESLSGGKAAGIWRSQLSHLALR